MTLSSPILGAHSVAVGTGEDNHYALMASSGDGRCASATSIKIRTGSAFICCGLLRRPVVTLSSFRRDFCCCGRFTLSERGSLWHDAKNWGKGDMLVLRRVDVRRALPRAVLKHAHRARSIGAALACILFASAPAFAQTQQEVVSDQINFAEFVNIETINFLQSNAELDANINTAPITDFLLQSALITQSNSVVSTIAIDDGGDVVVNQLITGSQRNGENLTNLDDFVSPISVIDSFTQSADVNQSNAIASNIAVENSGRSTGYFRCDH